MKKLFLMLACLAIAGCGGGGEEEVMNGGDKSVIVGESGERLFPDPVFNEYCQQFDTNGDGVLTTAEKEAVAVIDIYGSVISLEGLDMFYNLRELRVSSNDISSIDVRRNENLTLIYIKGIQGGKAKITELDLSKNTELAMLYIDNASISAVDVSNNTKLSKLICNQTNISSLDITRNPSISHINIWYNNLSNNAIRQLLYDLPLIDTSVSYNTHGYIGYNKNQRGQTENPFTPTEELDITKSKGWDCYGHLL